METLIIFFLSSHHLVLNHILNTEKRKSKCLCACMSSTESKPFQRTHRDSTYEVSIQCCSIVTRHTSAHTKQQLRNAGLGHGQIQAVMKTPGPFFSRRRIDTWGAQSGMHSRAPARAPEIDHKTPRRTSLQGASAASPPLTPKKWKCR